MQSGRERGEGRGSQIAVLSVMLIPHLEHMPGVTAVPLLSWHGDEKERHRGGDGHQRRHPLGPPCLCS